MQTPVNDRDSNNSASELARWKNGPYPRYQDEVNASIGFTGLSVDFFIEGKARHLVSLMHQYLRAARAQSCLDVGCGVGIMHRYLRDSVDRLHGVDVSDEAIKAASESNPWASYHRFDGQRLPFDNSSFDVVFASCVLHHVEPVARPHFMREAYRVLRPGGFLAIFEHNPINPLTRLAVLRCEFDRGAVLLSRREAGRLIREAGFAAVEGRYIFFLPLRGAWARKIDAWLGSLALGAQYYSVGVRPGIA